MAFPLDHRSSLAGVLLVGAKSGGEEYRPDEIASLAFAAERVRIELHALTMEHLKKRAEDLQDENAMLRAQLELARGSHSVSTDLSDSDGAR